jgi:putative aldouronate transport system substrate-binding protein
MTDVEWSGASANAQQLTRRAVLATALAISGGLLAACTSPATPQSSAALTPSGASATSPPAPTLASASAPAGTAAPAGSGSERYLGVQLPTFIPRDLVRADYPSSDPNVSPGYDTYPTNPPKANATAPGKGGEISTYTTAYYPLPTPMDQNPAWQEVNKQLGVSVRMSPIGVADNLAKFSTMMAGNDIPDLIHMIGGWNLAVRSLPQFIESACADLTPHLSGDAIKAYPNLAAIPPQAWKQAIYHAKILALPIHRAPSAQRLYYSTTTYDAVIGKDVVAKTADDFKRILQQLTSAKDGKYAYVVNSNWDMINFSRIFGAPNGWRLEGGKLVHAYETEQYMAAVGYVRDLWAAGLIYPDSFTFASGSPQIHQALSSGKAVMGPLTTAFYPQLQKTGAAQNQSFRAYRFFSADGGRPVYFFGTGSVGLTSVKKGAPERVQEMLGVLNWLAAPFGSQEDRLLQYGVEGADYKLDDKANPVPTDRGLPDAAYVPWRYLGSRPYVLYDPTVPNYAQTAQADEKDAAPYGIPNATNGLYSPTATSSGVTLGQRVDDGVSEIIKGLRPVSDFDQLARDWVTAGGDKIRSEYQQALDGIA